MAALSGGAGAGMSGGRQGNVRRPGQAARDDASPVCGAVIANIYVLDQMTGAAAAGGQPCALRSVRGDL